MQVRFLYRSQPQSTCIASGATSKVIVGQSSTAEIIARLPCVPNADTTIVIPKMGTQLFKINLIILAYLSTVLLHVF